jgi:phosphate transport system permease protein
VAHDVTGLTGSFPEGESYKKFVDRRQSRGRIWLTLFMTATLVGVVALMALLLTVINDAFGYIAIQNNIDPETLVMSYHKDRMLAMPSTRASEDDAELAAGIAPRDQAVGFFGYGVYQQSADELKLLSVDGQLPSAETVASGAYSLARPLYLYSSDTILDAKPQVAAFLGYYLKYVTGEVESVGYFPVGEETTAENLELWTRTTGLTETTADNLQGAAGDVSVTGSSTVAPITQRMADLAQAGGFTGNIAIESIGTDAGFRSFCLEEAADIANASRAMNTLDISACNANYRNPLEFQVGNDGLSVVVSGKNDFVADLTRAQLQQVFTEATSWNEIDPGWPEKKIFRFIPGKDSGTLDFFVEEVFGSDLASQSPETLIGLLSANLSAGRVRALDAEKLLAERSGEELRQLVTDNVVQPKITKSWNLLDSLRYRTEIIAEVAQMPNADLQFHSWVNYNFLVSTQSSQPEKAGIRVAILGSIWITLLAMIIAVPIGIGAAIYLEEFAGKSWLDQAIETNINNLAGVPSIIYGMLGLAVFVRLFSGLTSGVLFGFGDESTSNGRTILSGALTLALLVLPLLIINAREAIRAVPRALREASLGLGATQLQTVWYHVLPSALPGILTGTILALGRVLGETAPLIVVGVSTYIVVNPQSPFDKFTTLPAQIYQWTSRPQPEFQHLAAAAILVLLVLLLALNATAILLRNRYSRRV